MSKLDKTKTILDELRTWRNYAMTSLIALIAFNFTQILNINSWLSLIFFCALFLLFAYLMAYFLLFNSYEKTLFKNKIKGHVRL